MTIQRHLESATYQLADELLQEPYTFFTEAEAVSRFHQLLLDIPALLDGVDIFFRGTLSETIATWAGA